MKTLETHFTKKGWQHQQLKREGMIALYKRWKDTSPEPHFEVIRVQEFPERTIGEATIPATEAFPSESLWGSEGWTFCRLADAKACFDNLVNLEPARIASKIARQKARIAPPV